MGKLLNTVAWKLLIVDDNDELATNLAEIFTTRGYKVWRAPNGRDAIDTTLRNGFRPDAILLDLAMPTMDGDEFLRTRATEPLLATSPVILLTSYREQATRFGVQVYEVVGKPPDLERLIDAVHRACHAPTAPPVRAA